MDFLEIILSSNTTEDCQIAVGIITGSFLFAIFLHSVMQDKICEQIADMQNLLTIQDINRLSALLASFLPVLGYSLSHDFLAMPDKPRALLHALTPTASQVLLILILEIFLIQIIENWLAEGSSGTTVEQEEDVKKGNKLANSVRIILLLVIIFLAFVNFGFFFNILWKIVLATIGLFICLCIFLIFQLKGFTNKGRRRAQSLSNQEEVFDKNASDLQLQISIVELFLKIYAYQLGVQSSRSAKYSCVEEKYKKNEYIYELHVLAGGGWKSRRMTIGRLGVNVVSRSKCYYVIYDAYLVIKIPPEPITDIRKYIKMLREETRIADTLKMKECIIPKLSVILGYVHPSFRKETSILEEVESRYLKPLFVFSNLHSFLKINNSFVFFMDLSKYYFLQDTLEKIHDYKERVYEEMCLDSRSILPIRANNRQKARLKLYKNTIEEVYSEFETAIRSIKLKKKEKFNPSSSWIEKAFFMRITGHNEDKLINSAPHSFTEKVNELTDNIFLTHDSVITGYQKAVKNSVFDANFQRNKASIKGIVSNLLDLLARLGKRGVAVRDLKPDNLLVAGDQDKYPQFLAHPERYKIGLIDVETAAILNKLNESNITQPQLGGTDQYATPSHFIDNTALMEMFGGVSRILHLQDWYAIIAISYKVILGEFLFKKTADFIPIIVKEISNSISTSGKTSTIAKEMSILFWRQATAEFKEKTDDNKYILEDIEIPLTESAHEMFQTFIMNEYRDTGNRLKKFISTRKIFSSKKHSDYLLSLTCTQIRKNIRKWQNRESALPSQEKRRMEVVETLQEYLELKIRFQRHKKILKLLMEPSATISAYALLESMFEVVYRNMLRKDWKIQEITSFNTTENAVGPQKDKTIKATALL